MALWLADPFTNNSKAFAGYAEVDVLEVGTGLRSPVHGSQACPSDRRADNRGNSRLAGVLGRLGPGIGDRLSVDSATTETTMDSSLVRRLAFTFEKSETTFEFFSDAVLGAAFLATAVVAAKRSHGGAETTVVTAFYSLILLTSSLRSVWFLIPASVWSPYYTPHAVMAFDSGEQWGLQFLEIVLMGLGSLCLFSIFILILVYWADILKKYFYPGARRSKPMVTFLLLVAVLLAIQLLNAVMFLCRRYSSEGMILVNSITMSLVSIVCVCEITIFSHRFRTVLKTLGDLNQVSTESQVKRIIWITVTGNIFFFTRAFLETTFAIVLIIYWHRTGTVAEVFSHAAWDSYILLKHWSELAILALMLYILQSRFTNAVGNGAGFVGSEDGYQAVPDTDKGDNEDTTLSV